VALPSEVELGTLKPLNLAFGESYSKKVKDPLRVSELFIEGSSPNP
jgi:hypothetical protein